MNKLYAKYGKRIFDIAISIITLVLCSPILALTAMIILFAMGRPIIYSQRRPGYLCQPFTIYKFRTMREPRTGESRFKSDDDRLTWIGRGIRKTSLDELPELINVLRGQMSLVGPRPLLMEYLPKYTAEQSRRHEVRPGITGLAQTNGRQNIPFSKRLELDVKYVDNVSFIEDCRILYRTVYQAIAGKDVVPGQRVEDIDDLGLSSVERDKNGRQE